MHLCCLTWRHTTHHTHRGGSKGVVNERGCNQQSRSQIDPRRPRPTTGIGRLLGIASSLALACLVLLTTAGSAAADRSRHKYQAARTVYIVLAFGDIWWSTGSLCPWQPSHADLHVNGLSCVSQDPRSQIDHSHGSRIAAAKQQQEPLPQDGGQMHLGCPAKLVHRSRRNSGSFKQSAPGPSVSPGMAQQRRAWQRCQLADI